MGPGVNSRPGLYFLKHVINPRPLNRTSFYSRKYGTLEISFSYYGGGVKVILLKYCKIIARLNEKH